MAEENRNLTLQQVRSTALAEAKQFETDLLKACAPEKQIKPLITCCPSYPIQDMLFTPDGQTLISMCGEVIRLWDVQKHKFFQVLEIRPACFQSIALTQDGQTLLSHDEWFRIWDMKTHQCVKIIRKDNNKTFVLSPDNHTVIVSKGNTRLPPDPAENMLYVWDLDDNEKTQRPIETCADYAPKNLAISPDGRTIIYDKYRADIGISDVVSGKCIGSLKGHVFRVEKVVVSPDGKTVISGSADRTIRIWDLETKRCLQVLTEHSDAVSSLAITPDGQKIVSGSEDKTLRIWDLHTGQIEHVLFGHTSSIKSIAIDPDGQTIASGGADGTIFLWNIQSGQRIEELRANTYPARSITLSQGKQLIISESFVDRGQRNFHLQEYNAESCIHKILKRDASLVFSIAISSDGNQFALGGAERQIEVFNTLSLKLNHVLVDPKGYIHYLAFSPDGRFLASKGMKEAKGAARIWDLNTGICLYSMNSESIDYSVVFSPDSRTFLTNAEKKVFLWDLHTGLCLREIAELEFPEWHDYGRLSLAVHPDGKTLVAAKESYIQILDMQTGKKQQTFRGHTKDILALAISPDGKVLLSGSYDGTIKFWDYDSGELLATTYNLDEGYLWSTPPDALAEYGWLYTDRSDLISLMALDPHDSSNVEYIPEADERFINYMKIYNDRDMVMKRISERTRFEELLRLRTSIQNEMNLKLLLAQTQNEALYLPRPGE